MSQKLYKALGMDLKNNARQGHEKAIDGFIEGEHRVEILKAAGRKPGVEARARLRAAADRKTLRTQLGALEEALARNGEAVTRLGWEVKAFLQKMHDETADLAKHAIEATNMRQVREEKVKPEFSPTPF